MKLWFSHSIKGLLPVNAFLLDMIPNVIINIVKVSGKKTARIIHLYLSTDESEINSTTKILERRKITLKIELINKYKPSC